MPVLIILQILRLKINLRKPLTSVQVNKTTQILSLFWSYRGSRKSTPVTSKLLYFYLEEGVHYLGSKAYWWIFYRWHITLVCRFTYYPRFIIHKLSINCVSISKTPAWDISSCAFVIWWFVKWLFLRRITGWTSE